MLFNSLDFGVFLPLVFLLYWFVFKSRKAQNILLLIASYVFYGWWDYRFLSLIVFSSAVDYFVGIKLSQTDSDKKRKLLLATSIMVNLGFLGFFKYYDFFLQNFVDAFTLFGAQMSVERLNIILPVGISFYTFQTLSYSIDVYKRKLEPTKDVISFFAFVNFFPQLVAGPIERATNLLPQFLNKRKFDHVSAIDGLKQILWGFFKKMVIADNCAMHVDYIFSNYTEYSGPMLVLGAFLFTLQIYGDFSGYSDIAIGTARLFGFSLMQNFAFPYFSRDIAEFWRRWHISLSTWFRDYVYIPLGGSRSGVKRSIFNVFVIFIVSGFWHGANWTFIAWGALNALYFLPLMLIGKNRSNLEVAGAGSLFVSLREYLQILLTFCLTIIAWVFFRSETLSDAVQFCWLMVHGIALKESYVALINYIHWELGFALLALIGLFFCVEWLGRTSQYAIEKLVVRFPLVVRLAFYNSIALGIFFFMNTEEVKFIYFNF